MDSVKWLGHASFMLNAEGKTIYIDPYEGEYAEKADLILVTHSHHDHCDTSKINKILKNDTTIFAPADCVPQIGRSVSSLKPGEKSVVERVTVEAYNYKRFRSPGVPYHPRDLGIGYLVTSEDKTIYHAGDSDFIPEMKELSTRNIDLALLPSGDNYTMDNAEAAEAALAIKPKAVFPMHRWTTDPEEFKRTTETKSHIRVVTLKPGDQFTFQ